MQETASQSNGNMQMSSGKAQPGAVTYCDLHEIVCEKSPLAKVTPQQVPSLTVPVCCIFVAGRNTSHSVFHTVYPASLKQPLC